MPKRAMETLVKLVFPMIDLLHLLAAHDRDHRSGVIRIAHKFWPRGAGGLIP